MATLFKGVKNRAKTTLSGPIDGTTDPVTMPFTDPSVFPASGSFWVTVDDEIFLVTAPAMSGARAQQGTTKTSHSSGTNVSLNVTAQALADIHTAINALENAAPPTTTALDDLQMGNGSGAWVKQTIGYLQGKLQALTGWNFAQPVTFTGLITLTNGLLSNLSGTTSTPAIRIVDASSGIRRSAANAWNMVMNSVDVMRWTTSTISSFLFHTFSAGVGYAQLQYDPGNTYRTEDTPTVDTTNSSTTVTFDGPSITSNGWTTFPLPWVGEFTDSAGTPPEKVLVTAVNGSTGAVTMVRAQLGTTGRVWTVANGSYLKPLDDGFVTIGRTGPAVTNIQNASRVTNVYLPPRGTVGAYSAPFAGQVFKIVHGGGTGPNQGFIINVYTWDGAYIDTIDVHKGSIEVQYFTSTLDYSTLNRMKNGSQVTYGGGTGVTVSTAANTTETDLHTFTVPPNTLINTGDRLMAVFTGITGANANTKRIRTYLDGTLCFDSTAFALNGISYRIDLSIIRISSTQVRVSATGNFAGVTQLIATTDITVSGFANGLVLKMTGQNGSAVASDISALLSTWDKVKTF